MKLKKGKNNKTERIQFRATEKEFNKITAKANIYTDGNISAYVLYSALNFVPGKEDFETFEEAPPTGRKRRGPLS